MRESRKRKPAALILLRRTPPGLLDQQTGGAFEFIKKPGCERAATITPVQPWRFGKIKLCATMKRLGQASSARKRARTSDPEASFYLRVTLRSDFVPGFVACLVGVETGDDAIEQPNAL